MRKSKINIRDIARLARVSVATVSRVINNSPNVSPKTRERVLQVIKEFDYHPSALAQGLSKARTKITAFLVPYARGFFFSDVFFPLLIKGMNEVFEKENYNVILSVIDKPVIPQKYISLYKSGIVDGYLLANVSIEDSFPEILQKERIPFVSVGKIGLKTKYPYVDVDNLRGAYKGVEYFITQGHTRIAIIKGSSKFQFIRERYEGYILALKRYGIAPDPKLEVEEELNIEGGYRGMKKLLSLNSPPTAVFACSDYVAIGAIRAIEEQKLNIPEDIAIIGFDNIYIDDQLDPPLASIKQDIVSLGKEAAKLFLKILEDPSNFEPIVLPTEFIWRRSAGYKSIETVFKNS